MRDDEIMRREDAAARQFREWQIRQQRLADEAFDRGDDRKAAGHVRRSRHFLEQERKALQNMERIESRRSDGCAVVIVAVVGVAAAISQAVPMLLRRRR